METISLSRLSYHEKSGDCVRFGIPWARGAFKPQNGLSLQDELGADIPVSTGCRAFWPDGSVKWSFHSARTPENSMRFTARKTDANDGTAPFATEGPDAVFVDTGPVKASFPKRGTLLAHLNQSRAEAALALERRDGNVTVRDDYTGHVLAAALEEENGVRCVVKVSGIHRDASTGRELFPFIVRFYLFKKSAQVRIVHTFLYDGESDRDFIKGIGVRFHVPMTGEAYNRHVKIAGDRGFFHEPLKLLTSWRPRLDASIYERQFEDEILRFDKADQNAAIAIGNMTTWDKIKVCQDSSEHFVIRKNTRGNACAYIDAAHGGRSRGLASISCETGGLAVAMKDFWQKYPSTLSIEDASTDTAKMTAWFWPPEAEAADLRHYDTEAHAQAYYEGFDEILSTPYGIANTNELFVLPCDGLIPEKRLDSLLAAAENPGILVCTPAHYSRVGAFGIFSLPDAKAPEKKELEEKLDGAISFYINEIEQRKWYGFFHYGDFMHTYDNIRHCWKYDMGGYAWQNTELVPTLWLWLSFMRSGKPEIYRLAESMARHASEVDVYHIGPYKGLGSRHNVIHWGCACKEARIAMAGHHRYYYYLTGDERIGDVLDDVKDADHAILRLDPLRHFYDDGQKTHARTGPDWSSFCSNWMTAWERHGDTASRDKLLRGVACIKKAPYGLLSGSDYGYDPETGELIYIGEKSGGGSHLTICMGAPQIWFEMADMIEDDEWNELMAEYGRFYALPEREKERYKPERASPRLPSAGWAYPYMAAAMIAYAARRDGDRALAKKVWRILTEEMQNFGFSYAPVEGGPSAFVQKELKNVSTNFLSQWCLNVIVCMALIGEHLDEETE